MSLNNLGINININVNAGQSAQAANSVAASLDKVAAAGRRATPPINDLRDSFKAITGAFTQLTIAKSIFGVFEAITERTNDVAQGLANIRSVMEDSFGPGQEAHLTRTMMNVAEETGKSFKDVAEATKSLIAQGLSTDQAEKIVEPLMKFAKVGNVSAEGATDLALGLSNMGISAEQTGMALDIMNNMANKTALNAKDFTAAMTAVAPIAHQNNQDFNDLVVTLGMLRKGFASANTEGTALRNTFIFLGKAKVQGDIKQAFGVDVLDKTTGKMRKVIDIIKDVNDAISAGHGSQANLSKIFGGRTGALTFAAGREALTGGMDFNNQHLTGQALIDEMHKATQKSGGAVEKSFEEQMNTFGMQAERLKTAFMDLVAVLGGTFLGSLTETVRGLADFVTKTREFLADHPRLLSAIGFIAAQFSKLAAGVGVVLGLSGGFKLLGFALGQIKGGIGGIMFKGVLGQMGTLLMMGGRMGGMFGMLSRVVGMFWKSMLGPLGLLLLAVEVIPSLFHALFGEKAPETTNQFGESNLEATKSLGSAADALTDAARAMAQATLEFNMIVAQYTGMLQHKASVLDLSAVGAAQRIGQLQTALGPGIALPAASQAANVAAIKAVFDFAKTHPGETIPESLTSEAVRAAQVEKGLATVLHTKEGDKQAKFMEDFVGAIENVTTKGSQQLAKDVGVANEERNVSRIGAPSTATFGRLTPRNAPGFAATNVMGTGMSPQQLLEMQAKVDRINKAGGIKPGELNGPIQVQLQGPFELKTQEGSLHGIIKAYSHEEAVKAGLEH